MSILIPSKTPGSAEVVSNEHLININTATLSTLTTLPGIGDILGQRIIDYRAEFGPFQTIEEIMNVSGIKTSVYEQIKTRIKV
jgi:competence protein ComEA